MPAESYPAQFAAAGICYLQPVTHGGTFADRQITEHSWPFVPTYDGSQALGFPAWCFLLGGIHGLDGD